MSTHATSLSGILKALQQRGDKQKVTLGTVIARCEGRGFGALLFVFSLIIFLPTGAIPGLAGVCALFIMLITAQMLIGRTHLWLPEKLKHFRLKENMIDKGINFLMPKAQWIDEHTHHRLHFLLKPFSVRMVALLCMALALLAVPMELIPMAGSLPAAAIMFLALGLMVEDGLLIAIGLSITLVALGSALIWLIG